MKTEVRRQKSEVRIQNRDRGGRGVLVAVSLFFAIVAMFLPGKASAKLTVKANHDHMAIGFFYHGDTVSVTGVSDPGTDIVFKITSPEGHEALRKKGKVGGVLWMNVGDMRYENTPGMYLLGSSKKVEGLLSPEERDKYVLGYPALKGHMEISPVADEQEKSEWFDEFVKYKESSRLYSVAEGDISLQEKDGRLDYSSRLNWPYQAAPGKYTVTAYAVKDKRVVETAQTEIVVEQVGSVKTLARMAKDSGALYGGLSILAALFAGFGVGMVFRKGGGSH
ncbi:MAG: TIGR02186 family protein [Thermodesulfovibrionales bacterium]|jgi:hypothetical protein